MQMQPVYFKISRTDISKTYPVNVNWTCTQFNDIMKYAIYLNFGHQRVEFVKTMQGNDTVQAEDFEGLSDSTMTLKDKFPEDIANKKLAFYIRILEEEEERGNGSASAGGGGHQEVPTHRCSVCYCDDTSNQNFFRCTHYICLSCNIAWAAHGNNTCPECRAER